ncbi:MAG: tetratricopeptide repeat protein [Pirellulales bacterium]
MKKALHGLILGAALHAGCIVSLHSSALFAQEPPAEKEGETPAAESPTAHDPPAVEGDAPPVSMHEPLVARVEMRLTLGDKVIDVIEKGDLLTVLSERADSYVIRTFSGQKGAVTKNNAVRLAESIEIYNDLLKEREKEGRLYTLRAGAWWALGETDKALEDFNKAIDLGYREAHAFASRGLFHAALGNNDAALADYSEAIKLNPKDSASLINRAAVYLATEKPDSAVADYSAALALDEKNGVLLQQRGIAYKAAGKLKEALSDYTRATELDEKDISAWMGRGFVYFQMGDHQAAIENFTKVIDLAPLTAVAYNNRGYNFQQLGKFREALADYDRAVELAPKYALAFQNKAWLHLLSTDEKLRNARKAVEAATSACDLSAYGNVNDLLALAAALAADGQFDKAIGWQEKVVDLMPDGEKSFAEKILENYRQKHPFDPKLLESSENSGGSSPPKTAPKPASDAQETKPPADKP